MHSREENRTQVGKKKTKHAHCKNAVLSGYITTLKNKQKLDVSSEGPSSRVSSRDRGKCTGFYTKSMKASRDKK